VVCLCAGTRNAPTGSIVTLDSKSVGGSFHSNARFRRPAGHSRQGLRSLHTNWQRTVHQTGISSQNAAGAPTRDLGSPHATAIGRDEIDTSVKAPSGDLAEYSLQSRRGAKPSTSCHSSCVSTSHVLDHVLAEGRLCAGGTYASVCVVPFVVC
jgi:hypothetical protein